MGKVPVSVIVMTKNEELNLRACLETLDFAAEVFVVDSHSTDGTLDIAQSFGATIVQFDWNGRWPKKKNWSILNLPFNYEWVLFVDADERITARLAQEIADVLSAAPLFNAYAVRFDYFFLGKQLKYGDPVYKTILFRHKLGQFEKLEDVGIPGTNEVEAHEQLMLKEGRVGTLQGRVTHYDFRSLWHYFHRHNSYSSWDAHIRFHHLQENNNIQANLFGSQPEKRRFFKQLYLKLPCRPVVWFFYSYFLRLGFLDGREGLYYNLYKAIYHFEIDMKIYEHRWRKLNGEP